MSAPRVTRHISTRYSSCCHTHASTWVHRYSSLLQWSVPLGQRGHVAMMGRIPGLWHIPPPPKKITDRNVREPREASNHTDLLVWYSSTQKTSPPERPFSHYIHSHRLAAEMWTRMKNKLTGGGKKNLSCSFYLYRCRKYVSYGFPIIIFL